MECVQILTNEFRLSHVDLFCFAEGGGGAGSIRSGNKIKNQKGRGLQAHVHLP